MRLSKLVSALRYLKATVTSQGHILKSGRWCFTFEKKLKLPLLPKRWSGTSFTDNKKSTTNTHLGGSKCMHTVIDFYGTRNVPLLLLLFNCSDLSA